MKLPLTGAARPGAQAPTPKSKTRVFARPARVLALVLVIGALALGAGLAFGLRGRAGDVPARAGEIEALAQQATSPLVVYSEFGLDADTIWAADPDDPAQRRQLGLVEHAYGFGVFPSLSPDGARVAYTVLAPLSDPDSPAGLWLLEVESGKTKRLAEGVDLRATPAWSAAADAVVVRRSEWDEATGTGTSQLVRVGLGGGEKVLASATDASLYAVDFSPDGAAFYYAALGPSGSDLARVDADGGGAATVAHLSDGFSRDWRLSPDGAQLAYLAQAPAGAGIAFVAQVLDLSTNEASAPLGDAQVEQFSPVWEPERGALTLGRLDRAAGPDAPVRLSADGSTLPALRAARRSSGFDVPLSWSPDGRRLAVRAFEGSSAGDPGPSRVEVVGTDGLRRPLSTQSDVTVAGWLEAAP